MKNFFARNTNTTAPKAAPPPHPHPPEVMNSQPQPQVQQQQALPPSQPSPPVQAVQQQPPPVAPTQPVTAPPPAADLFGGMARKPKKAATNNWSSKASNEGSETSEASHTTAPPPSVTTTGSSFGSGFSFISSTAPTQSPPTTAPAPGGGGVVIAARRKGKGGQAQSPTDAGGVNSSFSAPPPQVVPKNPSPPPREATPTQEEEPEPTPPPVLPPQPAAPSSFGFLNAGGFGKPPAPPPPPPQQPQESSSREPSEERPASPSDEETNDTQPPQPPLQQQTQQQQQPTAFAFVRKNSQVKLETNQQVDTVTRTESGIARSRPESQATTPKATTPTNSPPQQQPSQTVTTKPEASSKTEIAGHIALRNQKSAAQSTHDEAIKAIRDEALLLNGRKCKAFNSKTTLVKRRIQLLKDLKDAEAAQSQCVLDEDYLQAESYNVKIEDIKAKIVSVEKDTDSLDKELTDLDNKVYELIQRKTRRLDLFCTQLHDLSQSSDRALLQYTNEAQQKFETAEERIREDMEKARRAEQGARVDLENLQQRESKLNDKIAEQTKEIRAELESRQQEYTTVTDEIADLEARLELKRKQQQSLAEDITVLQQKVVQVRSDFSENLTRVEKQIEEDTKRLNSCMAVINGLDSDSAKITKAKEAAEHEASLRRSIIDEMNGEAVTLKTTVTQIQADLLLRKQQSGEYSLTQYLTTHKQILDLEKEATQLDESIRIQHNEIEQMLKVVDTMNAKAADVVKSIPELEAAKKVAVANRAFKDAQAKSDQIKKLTEEREKIDGEVKALRDKITSMEHTIVEDTKLLATKSQLVNTQRSKWSLEYRSALKRFQNYTKDLLKEAELIEGTHDVLKSQLAWIDSVLSQLPPDESSNDASSELKNESSQERISEEVVGAFTPNNTIAEMSSTVIYSENAKNTVESDEDEKEGDIANKPENESKVEEEEDTTAAPLPPPPPPSRPKEEILAEITQLDAQIQDHLSKEEYDECAELEERMETLRKELMASS